MSTLERCRAHLHQSSARVFRTQSFLAHGSRTCVQSALAQLVRESELIRIGVGVYARTKRSVLTGDFIPVAPLEVLASEALALFGVQVQPPKAYRDYNEGLTNQVPVRFVLNTGPRRITRRFEFNGRSLEYERG